MTNLAYDDLDWGYPDPWTDQHRTGVRDAPAANVCVIDSSGIIIKVNTAWLRFAEANGCTAEAAIGVGADYLEACAKGAAGDPFAAEALEGIVAVMQGWRRHFVLEYPCHAPSLERWFRMIVTPVRGRPRFIISHEQIRIPSLS